MGNLVKQGSCAPYSLIPIQMDLYRRERVDGNLKFHLKREESRSSFCHETKSILQTKGEEANIL